MNIMQVLQEYDAMFGVRSLSEIEEYLYQKIVEAVSEGADDAVFTLLNEMIGLCRDTMQKEKGLSYCGMLLNLMEKMQLTGSAEYATALLNIANAYRAFGKHGESFLYFSKTLEIYENYYEHTNFAYANLYNNWSLLYQEMGEFEKAADLLKKALEVVDRYPDEKIRQAITRSNLAASLLQAANRNRQTAPMLRGEALSYLQEALEIFEADGGVDFHYGAALVTMGDAKAAEGDFAEAASWYQRGLLDVQKHVGQTDNYFRVLEKYQDAVEKSGGAVKWKTNLERSFEFYKQYGKTMIQEKFPEYASRIAVGVVGEGSDCFGFDDSISADHDYAPGFCMWLTEEDFSVIGQQLQEAYEELVRKHGLYGTEAGRLISRRKVTTIDGFYTETLGVVREYEQWATESLLGRGREQLSFDGMEEFRLAHAVNGRIFRDDSGIFTYVRQKLRAYYPDSVWYAKIAAALHEFSQYAQSNYPRSMARKDMVTASLCISKAIECTMDLMYLLNRTYAPYYKWKKKGLETLPKLREVLPVLEQIAALPGQEKVWENRHFSSMSVNLQDEKVNAFERIAAQIVAELNAQGLAEGKNPFLESYVGMLMNAGRKRALAEAIVEQEWKQFDQVNNEGGRADCQDDWSTFSIMRMSQYLTWPEELLKSYLADLKDAQNAGWNLITEKYARMMKSTAPLQYAQLEKELPYRSEQRIAIQEEIIKIQVAWMEEFARKYPKMAGNARSIRTEEDHLYNTSYETYLRGELGTYSEETFVLYGRFVADLFREGKNLAYEIMSNTAKLYGYENVETAESRL